MNSEIQTQLQNILETLRNLDRSDANNQTIGEALRQPLLDDDLTDACCDLQEILTVALTPA